jgi:hypothetical protein
LGTPATLFISNLSKIKLLLIQTKFLEKYFHVYEEAVGKIALECLVNLGLS